MAETTRAPVDVFEKARTHDRKEQLEAAKEADLLPYFRLISSEAGPVVEMEGLKKIMLGSNNYLGLTGDPRVKTAARDALERYGTAPPPTGGACWWWWTASSRWKATSARSPRSSRAPSAMAPG